VSFLDWLLTHDPDGHLRATVDSQAADLAAGITWGVYDGDELVDTAPARHLAEFLRADLADGADRGVDEYEIRPVNEPG